MHLPRRRRHRRNVHRHRGRSAPRADHTKKVSSRVDNYARGHSRRHCGAVCARPAKRGCDRGGPSRHNGRVQRNPRAQGRARRADHHQRLPRRAGDPNAADATTLRSRVDKTAAVGRAISPPGRGRTHRSQGPRRPRARPGRRRARRRRAARRAGRGDRGVPDQLLRQSGTRIGHQGDHSAQSTRLAVEHFVRGATRDQGIRAHVDDGDQCLCDADRQHLSARNARRWIRAASMPASC